MVMDMVLPLLPVEFDLTTTLSASWLISSPLVTWPERKWTSTRSAAASGSHTEMASTIRTGVRDMDDSRGTQDVRALPSHRRGSPLRHRRPAREPHRWCGELLKVS